jgi:hypothetical protein
MSEAGVAGYELWDTESRNLLDDFDTEAEALEAVLELVALNGPDSAGTMALTRVHANGQMVTVAMGAELASRANTHRQTRGQLRV